MSRDREKCAACGRTSEGHYSIHRDGQDLGPEVPLCNACGSRTTPTCEQLWAAIAKRRAKDSPTSAPPAMVHPADDLFAPWHVGDLCTYAGAGGDPNEVLRVCEVVMPSDPGGYGVGVVLLERRADGTPRGRMSTHLLKRVPRTQTGEPT